MRWTVAFINCNRLFYLKSCVESFIESTCDYHDKELIIIDNASVEEGTERYLSEKERSGFTVIRNLKRDPHNEFARALNTVVSLAKGDLILPLQADTQFVVRSNWMDAYSKMFDQKSGYVGCAMVDAQRATTNDKHTEHLHIVSHVGTYKFYADLSRSPIACAGDVVYEKSLLRELGEWSVDNSSHEGGSDSETKMLTRVKEFLGETKRQLVCVVPNVSPAVSITTDARGTNARVRGNKRYGDYWPPKQENRYYEMLDDTEIKKLLNDSVKDNNTVFSIAREQMPQDNRILSIEDLARPIGFDRPVDEFGNWKKNPIRPETATEKDYVVLEDESQREELQTGGQTRTYIDEWLNS